MGILMVEDIKKYYGKEPHQVKAVDGISITLGSGFTAITGSVGSGKTTLLHILAGMIRPTSGTVIVNNTDLSVFSEEDLTIFRRRNLGLLFREHTLIPAISVYENIIFPVELDGSQPDFQYIQQISSLLGIQDKLNENPRDLSGGELQKVAIARALSTKPAVVLADEPTGNLDSKTGMEVVGLLKLTGKEFRQTIVMVTQDGEIARLADRVLYLKDGKILRIEEKRNGYARR